MLGIRVREMAGAAVNKTAARSWGRSVVAPRHGFEPRFTAPKAAVLPLDDRGKSALQEEVLLQCSLAVRAAATDLLHGSAIIARGS